jgi:hypothetical protein
MPASPLGDFAASLVIYFDRFGPDMCKDTTTEPALGQAPIRMKKAQPFAPAHAIDFRSQVAARLPYRHCHDAAAGTKFPAYGIASNGVQDTVRASPGLSKPTY